MRASKPNTVRSDDLSLRKALAAGARLRRVRARVATLAAAVAALVMGGCVGLVPDDPEPALLLGTTTTVQDSGLLDTLLPAFPEATGIRVRAVVGGTGEILAKAARGDVDVVISHNRADELALVQAGHAEERRPLMYSRFLIVGPADDPARLATAENASSAFARVRDAQALFASRADESGTHARELELWRAAGADPAIFANAWYKQTGAGQAQTLLYADEVGAYALTDEPTWTYLRANGRLRHLDVAYQDDSAALRNQYAVLVVDAERHPHVREDEGARLAQWLTSEAGARAIASHRIDGQQLFFPNPDDPEA